MNQSETIYEAFIAGQSIEDAIANHKWIGSKTVRTLYNRFIYDSARLESNKSVFNLYQIRQIERDLWELIEKNLKQPAAENNNKIDQLQNTYSKYLV